MAFGVAGGSLPKGSTASPEHKVQLKLIDRKERFVLALAEHGNVSLAANLAGWRSRNSAYAHKEEDPSFAALWEEAEQISMDALEHKARERALGWLEPIFDKEGSIVGHRQCYSDKMMELLLKAHRPEKFRDKVDHAVTHGGGVVVIPQPMNQEEFERVAFEQQKRHREARLVSDQ